MTARLEGRVAIVTGGASGMGRAMVLRFLAEGAQVVIADRDEAMGAETIALALDAGFGSAARFVAVDVAVEADIEAMVALAVAGFGDVHVVCNNAGFGGVTGDITDIDLEGWNATMAVLLTGVFLGIKHGAGAMKAAGHGGSIINTASVAGVAGGLSSVPYTAAKHGVIGLTRAAAVELAPDLIRVNAICPGGINTPLINRGDEQAAGAFLDRMQPWPHHGRGEDVAGAALFLAGDDSGFITGEALVVDGGLLSRPLANADGRGPR